MTKADDEARTRGFNIEAYNGVPGHTWYRVLHGVQLGGSHGQTVRQCECGVTVTSSPRGPDNVLRAHSRDWSGSKYDWLWLHRASIRCGGSLVGAALAHAWVAAVPWELRAQLARTTMQLLTRHTQAPTPDECTMGKPPRGVTDVELQAFGAAYDAALGFGLPPEPLLQLVHAEMRALELPGPAYGRVLRAFPDGVRFAVAGA